MNYTVISKRKIAKLIEERIVKDWDDPRLFTLTDLRRRGFPPEAINTFVAQMGLTGALTSVDPSMLEAAVRDVLNLTAPRIMAVLEPLKVTINNLPFETKTLDVPDFPADDDSSKHQVTLGKVIFIERSDFKEIDERGYRRLTPNQSVGLRHAGFVISVIDVIKRGGQVVELITEASSVDTVVKKPKAFIHWVHDPVDCEVRLYDKLFNHKNPEDLSAVPRGFISDCNLNSLTVINDALVERSVIGSKVYAKYQFERNGFFSIDPDTKDGQLVFNRTVSLKEDKAK